MHYLEAVLTVSLSYLSKCCSDGVCGGLGGMLFYGAVMPYGKSAHAVSVCVCVSVYTYHGEDRLCVLQQRLGQQGDVHTLRNGHCPTVQIGDDDI